jgi:hypothetical protein
VVRTGFVLLGENVCAFFFSREEAVRDFFLGGDFLDDFVFDIGQAEITSRPTEREVLVVDAERVQNGDI